MSRDERKETQLLTGYQLIVSMPHLSFFADLEGEVLQYGSDGNFQSQKSKSHPNAVPGTSSKRQVCVWVYVVLVFLTEPG